MGVYDPYQVNDYISKGADKNIYCSDNSQDLSLIVQTLYHQTTEPGVKSMTQ